MIREHELTAQIQAAQANVQAADELVRRYLPFIQSETAKFLRHPVEEGDDELSVALFAFYQAVIAYRETRGAFLPFAAKVIYRRLVDFSRQERRHRPVISLETATDSFGRDPLVSPGDPVGELTERTAARQEISSFASQLADFGVSLADVADSCPKQARTLSACHRALAYAKTHPALLEALLHTKKLPLAALASGAGVDRKTLERHRRYLVAILLAYTNGFTIIRGHLSQVAPPQEV